MLWLKYCIDQFHNYCDIQATRSCKLNFSVVISSLLEHGSITDWSTKNITSFKSARIYWDIASIRSQYERIRSSNKTNPVSSQGSYMKQITPARCSPMQLLDQNARRGCLLGRHHQRPEWAQVMLSTPWCSKVKATNSMVFQGQGFIYD